MTLRERLAEMRAELQGLEEGVKSGDAETVEKAAGLMDKIDDLESQIAEIDAKRASVLNAMSPTTPKTTTPKENTTMKRASYIAKAALEAVKASNRDDMRHYKAFAVARKDGDTPAADDTPAASNDPVVIDPVTSLPIVDVDYSLVGNPAHTPLASVMGNYAINGNTYQWYVQDEFTGDFDTVAEAGEYPQMSDAYEPKTVVLQKLAGYIKESDEVLEDNAFLVSAVDDDLLYKLAVKESTFVATKILAEEGVQTPTALAANSTAFDIADAIYAAKSAVSQQSPYTADCIIINPADMQTLALAKDDNNQYVGGGYFTGAYGNGGINNHATVWGLPVFESAQIPAGTILVGAFKMAVKVVKNRGVEVAIATENEADFIHGLVAIRANERLAVAVKAPKAIVKITIASE